MKQQRRKILLVVLTVFALAFSCLFVSCGGNGGNGGNNEQSTSEPSSVTVQSISVTAPTKTQYEVGDFLDYEGAKITVTMSDGLTNEILFDGVSIPTGVSVDVFKLNTLGTVTVTVTYEGQTATFTVSVGEVHAHNFSTFIGWKDDVKPTETDPAVAIMKCACGEQDEVIVAKLTETSVWTLGTSTDATHFADGSKSYSNEVYGTITVVVPTIAHNYVFDGWKDGVEPTMEAGATAIMKCSCEDSKEDEVPAFTDDTVWQYTHLTDASHISKGSDEYLNAVYGRFIIEIPMVAHDYAEFDGWKDDVEPTLDLGATAIMKCECGATEEVEVADLTDDTVWGRTVTNPTYNDAGYTDFTNDVYGTIRVETAAKLVAAYDSRDYRGILFYYNNDVVVTRTNNDAYSMSIDANSSATDTFHKNSYSNATVSFKLNDETKPYGELTATFTWTSTVTTGTSVWDQSSHDEDNSLTETGYVTEDGYIVFTRDNSPISYFFFVPTTEDLTGSNFKTCYSWGVEKVLAYVNGDNRYNLFVDSTDKVYMDVSFEDLSGNEVNAEDITVKSGDEIFANVDYVAIKDSEGKIIRAYTKSNDHLTISDGVEGIYTNGGDTLTVYGNGLLDLNGQDGTYTINQDGTLDCYEVEEEKNVAYHVITLDGASYSIETPTVQLTFVVGDNGDAIEPQDANIKVAYTLPVPELKGGVTGCKFAGWYYDEEFTKKVEDGFVPSEAKTLYAFWLDKITLTVTGAKSGDTTSVNVGFGDKLLDSLPAYTNDTESDDTTKLFRGWFVGEVGEEVLIDENVIIDVDTEVDEVWAKWVDKVTLTVDYNGAHSGANYVYGAGDEIDVNDYLVTVDGYAFLGWFADGTYQTPFEATTITSDITAYADMEVSATPFYGTTAGMTPYMQTTAYWAIDTIYTRDDYAINVDLEGNVTGQFTGKIEFTNVEETEFTIGTAKGYYDPTTGIITISESELTPYFYALGGTVTVKKVNGLYQGSYCTEGKVSIMILTVTRGDVSSDVTIFVYRGHTFFNVHFTDKNNAAYTDMRAINLAVPEILNVYDSENNLVIRVGKNSSSLVKSDELEGTYTGSKGNVIIDGFGKLTVNGGSSVSYTVVSDGVVEYTSSTECIKLALDVTEKTYTAEDVKVNITFDNQGHGDQPQGIAIYKGVAYKTALPTLTAEGYNFKGWYTTRTENETTGAVSYSGQISTYSGITATEDITIYAYWAQLYTVTYTTTYGTAPATEQVEMWVYPNDKSIDDTDDYAFDGWTNMTTGIKVVNGEKVTADVTYSAIWLPKYTVTFTSDYGTCPESIKVKSGTEITESELAEKVITDNVDGYLFNGWKISGGEKITSLTVSDNTTLVAVWTESVTVTMVYGNGLANATLKILPGATPSLVQPPFTSGKVFDHWYLSDDAGATEKSVYTPSALNADLTVYSAWVEAYSMYGTYTGWNFYGDNKTTFYSFAKNLQISANGTVSGARTASIANEYKDLTNGALEMTNTEKSYYAYYNADANLIWMNDSSSSSTNVGTDTDVYVKAGITVEHMYGANRFNSKYLMIIELKDGDRVYTVFGYDNKVWCDVTFSQGATFANFNSSNWVVYDKDGNGLYAKSGNKVVLLDGYQGTYTNGADTITLDGAGNITGTYSGTYKVAETGADYTIYVTATTATYKVTLDTAESTYSIVADTVSISYVNNFKTIAAETVARNMSHTLVAGDELKVDGYVFRGWYANEDLTGSAVTKVTPKDNSTYYAKYDQAVTLTYDYNGQGTEAVVVDTLFANDKVGTLLTVPSDMKYGTKLFAGWFTENGTDDVWGDEVTVNTVITEDMTVYAKWVDVHPLMNNYSVGANLDPSETVIDYKSYSLSSSTYKLTVDFYGNATGWKTGVVTYDADNNLASINVSGSIYYGGASASLGIIYFEYYIKSSADHDIGFMVANKGDATPTTAEQVSWNKGITKLVKVNYSDNSFVYVLLLDRKVYENVTWSAVNSSSEAITDFAKLNNASVLTLTYGGNTVTFVKSGNDFVPLDGNQGTYTGTLESVVVDGNGGITVDGVASSYAVVGGNLYFALSNKQYAISLDKSAHTYTVVQDGYQGTYTLPDGQTTITLDGFGGAGTGVTYVVNGTQVSIFSGDGETKYGIDVDGKIFLGKSMFAGMTMSCSSLKLTFDDGVELSGKLESVNVYPKREYGFTAVEEGGVITFTITTENYSMGFVGKTFTATYTANSITFTSSFKLDNSDVEVNGKTVNA